MEQESRTGSNAVWAIALIIVVAIVAGVVYYSGVLRTNKGRDINIKVDAPAQQAPAQPPR